MKPIVFSALIINSHIPIQASTTMLFEQAEAKCPSESLREPLPGQQQPDPTEQGQIFT